MVIQIEVFVDHWFDGFQGEMLSATMEWSWAPFYLSPQSRGWAWIETNLRPPIWLAVHPRSTKQPADEFLTQMLAAV